MAENPITMAMLMERTPAELRGIHHVCVTLLSDAGESLSLLARQTQLAQIVADELNVCGHDLAGVDVLDALATCGMELIQPPDPTTAAAYSDALRRGLDS